LYGLLLETLQTLGGCMTPTYRIVRSHRAIDGTWDRTVETGIAGYAAADARRNELQKAEDKAHPDKNHWTKDLFIVEREPA
jgi:hypothetical protein